MVAGWIGWGKGQRSVLSTRTGIQEVVSLGSGEPLVLLHGLCGGQNLVLPLAEELAKTRRVIVPQLRGEEWSFCVRTYSLSDLAADVGSLFEALRLEKPALMGVSFGAAVALEFASHHPHCISELIIQGGAGRFRAGVFVDVAKAVLGRLPLDETSPVVSRFFRVLCGRRKPPKEQFQAILEHCWSTDQIVMSQRLAMLEGYDVSGRVGSIDCPASVLIGSEDVLIGAADAEALTNEFRDGDCQVLDGAGHLAFVTHAAAIAEAALHRSREIAAAA
jgi:pimeloyl-ACP methyl ester carboxylesterase